MKHSPILIYNGLDKNFVRVHAYKIESEFPGLHVHKTLLTDGTFALNNRWTVSDAITGMCVFVSKGVMTRKQAVEVALERMRRAGVEAYKAARIEGIKEHKANGFKQFDIYAY
jgi:hypothetical protein